MLEEKKRLDPEPANGYLLKSKNSKSKDNKLTWEFWGLYNKEFVDDDTKDLHYLENCPKLTSCPGCEQIIEKSILNSHILTEWDNKSNFKQWKEWDEPIKVEEEKEHSSKCLGRNNS